jgi:hypothetical protein
MPQHIAKRPMTQKERDFLSCMLKGYPTMASRWREGAVNAVLVSAGGMVLFIGGWQCVAWVVRAMLHAEIGWNSPAVVWILVAGSVLCVAGGVSSTMRWMKKWRDMRPALRADLESGEVAEEYYDCTAAKRFQEPEHGGLMYFLLTVDDKVFVLFDYESQGLGAEGKDPLVSEFQPHEQYKLVRAPHSEIVLDQNFSGAALEAGGPIELAVGPSKWPEWENYCEVKWEELEERFGKSRKRWSPAS